MCVGTVCGVFVLLVVFLIISETLFQGDMRIRKTEQNKDRGRGC